MESHRDVWTVTPQQYKDYKFVQVDGTGTKANFKCIMFYSVNLITWFLDALSKKILLKYFF